MTDFDPERGLALSRKRLADLKGTIEWATEERNHLIRTLYAANPELCSQRKLAEMTGLSQPGISKIINRAKNT
ncbi:winged helix-turn-helix transcriptional regulator [Nocardia jiangxiensis]|uniref:winged helix-turn-helix transcriptional regulator n=1 Tax=Nocardia jiangxiensis TaxID=282685 RepID=UPI00031F49DA|nr:winged helix-turn-helix transcriptional regulator [Nocardia jiangxiensis]